MTRRRRLKPSRRWPKIHLPFQIPCRCWKRVLPRRLRTLHRAGIAERQHVLDHDPADPGGHGGDGVGIAKIRLNRMDLADAAERVFHIKAIDEVGLLSPTASSVSAAVSPPDGVTAFDVVPQGDHVRASWEPVDGSGVEYELRAGLTWGTGRFVGRAAGNHLVALWPIRDATDETFWIKAVSPAGLYSDMAAYATTRLWWEEHRKNERQRRIEAISHPRFGRAA